MKSHLNFKLWRTLALAALCCTLAPAVALSQRPAGQKKTPPARPQATQRKEQPTPTPKAQQINSSVKIRWRGQTGVERYRLQVARDEAFSDIIFDEAVTGREHTVNLPSGNYFWRIAPAVVETGTYSTPQAVAISSTPTVVDERVVISASGGGGWRTATGEVPYLAPAKLRAGLGLDLVGVNTDGTVYAIDGTNGVALWTARYNPSAKRGETATTKAALFTPLSVVSKDGKINVAVAFDGGLRALRGETGSELWRARFEGRAHTGAVGDLDGDGSNEILALTSDPTSLIILHSGTGSIISNTKLHARASGAPAIVTVDDGRVIVLGYDDGTIEMRRAGGQTVNSVKLDSAVSTPPLVVPTSRDQIIVVGSGNGLFALGVKDLKLLGKIDTGTDAPRGMLLSTDIESDGSAEIVMLTRAGRVAVINTSDGRIRWVAEGAADSESAALADLNGDGVLDVITAAGATFANGFSGKDGALIWKVEDAPSARAAQTISGSAPRTLVIALSNNNEALLVGGDTSRIGLRAVELPKGAVKTAER